MFTDDLIQQIDHLQKSNEENDDYDPLVSIITPEWNNSQCYSAFDYNTDLT